MNEICYSGHCRRKSLWISATCFKSSEKQTKQTRRLNKQFSFTQYLCACSMHVYGIIKIWDIAMLDACVRYINLILLNLTLNLIL